MRSAVSPLLKADLMLDLVIIPDTILRKRICRVMKRLSTARSRGESIREGKHYEYVYAGAAHSEPTCISINFVISFYYHE